jgi:hypothetical protein
LRGRKTRSWCGQKLCIDRDTWQAATLSRNMNSFIYVPLRVWTRCLGSLNNARRRTHAAIDKCKPNYIKQYETIRCGVPPLLLVMMTWWGTRDHRW